MTKTKISIIGLVLAAIFVFLCSRTADPEPIPPLRSIFVAWDYALPYYRDALEFAVNILGPWSEVPGPYHWDKVKMEYQVKVEVSGPQKFFRVARTFGLPILPIEEQP